MKRCGFTHGVASDPELQGSPAEDAAAVDAQIHILAAAHPVIREAASLDDAYYLIRQVRLNVEVDDGVSVPVALDDHNAAAILEVTQRIREYLEREKSAIPPVQDFGEASWPGGEW